MHFRLTCFMGTSVKMGNNGAGIVRLRVLRQAIIPVLNGITVYRSHRSKKLDLFSQFNGPETGEMENHPI